ncbi:hypothetical protein [Dyadobacter sp. CY312]|uniref:hypothetical protein n=1 Tax=Dyadobacter sp. CY312 TaxID=2907303 RepID=UPI001F24B4CE|nr:hypothetical protein [Dyadobacter sp. CY312]MCE7043617.1 hypothetical protein [Dyadobacter sp. CY312]
MKASIIVSALFLVFTLSSCSKSKKEDISPFTNEVDFEGRKISLEDGLIEDYGAWEKEYNLEFYMLDDKITYNPVTKEVEDVSMSFLIDLDLYSGGDQFTNGRYTIVDSTGQEEKNSGYAYVLFSKDQKKHADALDFEEFEAISGYVDVSGKAPSYEVSFNLMLENGKTLKGNYNNGFVIVKIE